MPDTEKKFYVYVHKYASGPKQGQVFYVGKGQGGRFKLTQGRSKEWNEIVSYYGFSHDVLFYFENEFCALSFERVLISFYGIENLCNLTTGGQGKSGLSHSDYTKGKIRDALADKISCSNGMVFNSTKLAQDWLRSNGSSKADKRNILRAAKGGMKSAYGYSWAVLGYEVPTYLSRSEVAVSAQSRPLRCSNGTTFTSAKGAARWLRENGFPKASQANINYCTSGKNKTAYGYKWEYI